MADTTFVGSESITNTHGRIRLVPRPFPPLVGDSHNRGPVLQPVMLGELRSDASEEWSPLMGWGVDERTGEFVLLWFDLQQRTWRISTANDGWEYPERNGDVWEDTSYTFVTASLYDRLHPSPRQGILR